MMSLLAMMTKGGMLIAALLGRPARSRVPGLNWNISILPRMPDKAAADERRKLEQNSVRVII